MKRILRKGTKSAGTKSAGSSAATKDSNSPPPPPRSSSEAVHPDPGKRIAPPAINVTFDTPVDGVPHPVPIAPSIALSPRKSKEAVKIETDTFTTDVRAELMNKLSLTDQCSRVAEAIASVRTACAVEIAKIPENHVEVLGDRRILRFLRGHKFNIALASKMYGDMLRWRSENNIGSIRENILQLGLKPREFPHHGRVTRFYPSIVHFSDDKNGRPVHIDLVGRLEPRKLLSCFDQDEWMHHHVYCMEYNSIMVDQLSKEQEKIVRIVSVYDLAGLGMSHLHKPAVDLLKRTLKMTQDFYPEMMDQCFVVNTPKVFSACWSMVKPLLAERTVKKVQILGKDYRKVLVQELGAEALPVPMGGTQCHQNSPLAFDESEIAENDEDYTTMELAKGTSNQVTIDVEAESFIVWGFFATGGDVGVEIKFNSKNEDESTQEHVLRPFQKLESAGGSYEASHAGTLTLVFDNRHSW